MTISTGFGGAVVIDKKIYRGSTNLGGYFPRLILDGKNTADSLISGKSLHEEAKKKIDDNIKNTVELFELYGSGNEKAKEIVENFKLYLTAALLNISATINPDIIILGGGVLKSKGYFLEDVKKGFKNMAHKLAKDTRIEVTDLDEPGLLGACLIAKNAEEIL